MRATTTAVATQRGLCLFVGHTSEEPCKNGRTDRDVVWGADLCGPKDYLFETGCTLAPTGEYD